MPKPKPDLTLIEWVADLADAGFWVFPCYDNKRPATKHGFKDAVGTVDEAIDLFAKHPTATLIGVKTGKDSNLIVVDFDLYKSPLAKEFLDLLTADGLLTPTRVQETRSGGLHYFYSGDGSSGGYPSTVPCEGVDVKGEGGYVIFWEAAGCKVLSTGITAASAELIARLKAGKQSAASASVESIKAAILRAENFHDNLTRLAARLSGSGMSQGDVMRALVEALRGSVASTPHHARHDRWRSLLEDKDRELSRIIGTAHAKYNPTAASSDMADTMWEQHEVTEHLAAKLFKSNPHSGDSGEPLSIAYDPDKWPFDGEGYFAHETGNLLDHKFVMHPLLSEGEAVMIAADPKAGKTVLAVTMGLHIACGMNLGDSLKVSEPRSVLYFGLEGALAIRRRIKAWAVTHEITDEIPMFSVTTSYKLSTEERRIQLATKIVAAEQYCAKHNKPSLGLIVIDTLTKAMGGGDQNDAGDTEEVLSMAKMLHDVGITAAVMFIHHKGKTGAIRGSTNIEAAVDVIASVVKEGAIVTLSIDKARSIEEGGSYVFEMSNVVLGISEQGQSINAPIATPIDAATESGAALSMASITRKTLDTILIMGVGTHQLQAVLDHLAKVGLGPTPEAPKVRGVRMKAAPVTPEGKEAQAYFSDLIPATGMVFKNAAMSLVRTGGLVTAVFIR
jgi:hypothetical protein